MTEGELKQAIGVLYLVIADREVKIHEISETGDDGSTLRCDFLRGEIYTLENAIELLEQRIK